MVFILEFFSSKTGIISLILLGGWFWHISAVNEAIENAAIKANAERNVIVQAHDKKEQTANDKQKFDLKTAYETGQKDMKDKINAIPKKVTKIADNQCTITTGFLQSYSTAFNLPPISIPTGGTVDSASGIPISDIARADTINGSICLSYKRESLAWREWYKRNKTNYDDYCTKSKSCDAAPTNSK